MLFTSFSGSLVSRISGAVQIAWKLEQQQQENSAVLKSQRRMFHHQIERGNPRRTFTGMAFIEG
ncbi:hypothetical protein CPH39_19585 [Escherichia coli]|nr:hypothetical protein CPH39_19585 [Escherichia coli]